jgi:type III pantothenate kinase
MLLAVDTGNTNTLFGIFENDKILRKIRIQTDEIEFSRNQLELFLKNYDITKIGISSVVPEKNTFLNKLFLRKYDINPVLISGKNKLPIKLKVLNQTSLGSDRICNAVTGYFYFKKRENVIVVDCGTAITYDVVLKNGSYEGGSIAPGLNSLARSLNQYTSKLPLLTKQDFKITDNPVGKHSVEALNSGVVSAFIDSVNGMISRIQKYYKYNFKIIITGGDASFIKPNLKYKCSLLENCVLEGINIILKELNEH